MCAHYLVRKGSASTFQIRLPSDLAGDSTLSRIRISLGAMTALEARKQALLMAGAAQIAFTRVLSMEEESLGGDAAKASEEIIRSLVPMLAGLDPLNEGVSRRSDPEVVDHVFDVLAHIGHDQPKGTGLFANPNLRPEARFVAALKRQAIARAYACRATLEDLSDTSSMLSTIQSLYTRIEADTQVKSAGKLFSMVAKGRIDDIKNNKDPDHELVGIYERAPDEFIALCGDRRVGDYRRRPSTHVDEISWLAPEALGQKGYDSTDVARHFCGKQSSWRAWTRRKHHPLGPAGLREGNHRLGLRGCRYPQSGSQEQDQCPDRAQLPVARIAPDGKGFETVWRAGIETGVLSDALLPPLGLLTGRRIGLLATLRREDIVQLHGVWVLLVRSNHYYDGRWEPVPIKTDASRGMIIPPQILAESGFVNWAKREAGPIFPALIACKQSREYRASGQRCHS